MGGRSVVVSPPAAPSAVKGEGKGWWMNVILSSPLSAAEAGDVLVYIDPREIERGLTGTTNLHYAPTTPWASG
jgi:hypothetical protein